MKKFRKNDIISREKYPRPGDKYIVISTNGPGQEAEILRYCCEGYSALGLAKDPEQWYFHGRNTFVGIIKDIICFWKWDWSWLI